MTQLENALLGLFGKEALELIVERLYDVLAAREQHTADERKEKQ
jgi:hypothetical protein